MDSNLREDLITFLAVAGSDEIDERRASARRNRPITKAALIAGLKALRDPKIISRREIHQSLQETLG